MNELQQLCHGLLVEFCEFWSFAKANGSVDVEAFRVKIKDEISSIYEKCDNNIQLKRDFARVEKPLVFFIDYIIKESNFSFSCNWQELAREYNELSGDDKFFDLLAENLDDVDATNSLQIFYLILGLGFDGCYQDNNELIEKKMKLCLVRFDSSNGCTNELLFKPIAKEQLKLRKRDSALYKVLLIATIFFLGSFLFNLYTFYNLTYEFNEILNDLLNRNISYKFKFNNEFNHNMEYENNE